MPSSCSSGAGRQKTRARSQCLVLFVLRGRLHAAISGLSSARFEYPSRSFLLTIEAGGRAHQLGSLDRAGRMVSEGGCGNVRGERRSSRHCSACDSKDNSYDAQSMMSLNARRHHRRTLQGKAGAPPRSGRGRDAVKPYAPHQWARSCFLFALSVGSARRAEVTRGHLPLELSPRISNR